jgi:cardiolipin synthase
MALTPDASPSQPAAGHESAWYAQREAQYSGGNEVTLLTGGDQLFPAMHAAIARARHEVWLATYIFHDDAASRQMADTLIAAAQRGVRVRVVVDGFGSKATLPTLRRWFDASGVALAVFRPLDRWYAWLQPGQLRRLHQKLLAADNEQAFVGGINIIDDRIDLNHGATPEPRLDFAVALRGPVVGPVAQTARAMWTRAAFGRDWRDEVLALARSTAPVARAKKFMRRLRISRSPAGFNGEAAHPMRAAFLVRDNLSQRRAIERSYIEALRHARERIDLVSAYFYPGQAFRRALRDAARRGVRVRLLLQGKLDYRFAGLAASVLYAEMLSNRVRIYEYVPAFLHAKAALVDDDWATVGSSNIDPLSLLLNLESNVVVRDPGFSATLATAFEQAIAVSREVTVPAWAPGWTAALRRGFVAWVANWYLRLAGISSRY